MKHLVPNLLLALVLIGAVAFISYRQDKLRFRIDLLELNAASQATSKPGLFDDLPTVHDSALAERMTIAEDFLRRAPSAFRLDVRGEFSGAYTRDGAWLNTTLIASERTGGTHRLTLGIGNPYYIQIRGLTLYQIIPEDGGTRLRTNESTVGTTLEAGRLTQITFDLPSTDADRLKESGFQYRIRGVGLLTD